MRRIYPLTALLATLLAAVGVGVVVADVVRDAQHESARVEGAEVAGTSMHAPMLIGRPHTRDSDDAPAPRAEPRMDGAWRDVSCRVIDERGNAIAGASIHDIGTHRDSGPGWERTLRFACHRPIAMSGADGRFEVAAVEQLYVAAAAEWSASLLVEVPASGDVVLVVARAPNLTGRVLASGGARPAANVEVRARASNLGADVTSRTMEDGAFALRIPPGIATADLLVGAFEDEPPSSLGIGVALDSVEIPRYGLTVSLAEPARLEGLVVGLDGAPVPAAVDVLRVDSDSTPYRARAEARDGTFGLAHVRPGRYVIRARPLDPKAGAVGEPVEVVVPGDNIRLAVREPQVLLGRLIGEDVAGFRVLLLEDDAQFGKTPRDDRTDVHGRFEFHGLHGSVRILAHRMGDDRYADLVVAPEPAEWSIHLHTGQRIEGRLGKGRTYDGARILAQKDGVEVGALVEPDGRFSVGGLAPGTWHLLETTRVGEEGLAIEWTEYLHIHAEAGTVDVFIR